MCTINTKQLTVSFDICSSSGSGQKKFSLKIWFLCLFFWPKSIFVKRLWLYCVWLQNPCCVFQLCAPRPVPTEAPVCAGISVCVPLAGPEQAATQVHQHPWRLVNEASHLYKLQRQGTHVVMRKTRRISLNFWREKTHDFSISHIAPRLSGSGVWVALC